MSTTRVSQAWAWQGLAALLLAGCASAGPARMPMQTGGGLQAGIQAFQSGNYALAEQSLTGLGGAEANAYLAAALAKQGKFAQAEGPANVALGEVPAHALAAAALGESLVGLTRYDDAIARMTSVVGADKNVAYAYYWRGQAYYRKRQNPDRMVTDFEAFLKLAPDAPEAAAVRQLLSALR